MIRFLAAIALRAAVVPSAFATGKEDAITSALAAAQAIHRAASNTSSPLSQSDKDALLASVAMTSDVQVLEKTALLCASIAWPQEAGNANYDTVFDDAFWACAYKLASIPGPEAADALRDLRTKYANDGGGSLTMKYLIDKQQGRLDPAKPYF